MASYWLCALVALLGVASTQAHINDVDVLNFALNLEYLEAEFYSWAAFGKGIPSHLRGGGPAAVGGQKAKLSADVQKYAEAIALDEIAHVAFLRAALGKAAVPQPKLDIGAAFSAAANAAVGATLSPPFSPYAGDIAFFLGAFIFEDVGATAYKGAAPLIKSKAYLEAAAGILGTEAYHAGAVRSYLLGYAYQKVYNTPIYKVVDAISNLRDAVDGKTDLDQGIIVNGYKYNIAPSDSNKIIFSRSPAQVLPIVYLGGVSKGGFYPDGLNGKLA